MQTQTMVRVVLKDCHEAGEFITAMLCIDWENNRARLSFTAPDQIEARVEPISGFAGDLSIIPPGRKETSQPNQAPPVSAPDSDYDDDNWWGPPPSDRDDMTLFAITLPRPPKPAVSKATVLR